MAIGTSLGAYFEDDFQHHAGVETIPKAKDGVIKPKDTGDDNALPPNEGSYDQQRIIQVSDHPNFEDRREQSSKERDNDMVDDQQLPADTSGGMNDDVFGKLSKDAGAYDLDVMERNNIVAAIIRGQRKK